MKKYNRPTTEMFHLNVTTAILEGSSHLEIQSGNPRQNLTTAGILGESDNDGSQDLAKGGGLWDD